MLESLEYTARIRPRSIDKEMGDDLPDDLHHDYTLHFDGERIELNARDDRGICKCIPLTESDIEKMNDAVKAYHRMKAAEVNNA